MSRRTRRRVYRWRLPSGTHENDDTLEQTGLISENLRLIFRECVFNGVRIDFATEYKVRLLTSVEPFTETIGGSSFTTLTKKPRHYVGSDLDFMVSDALGISLKYRYGSQPPAFRFVDHTASVGLTFKLKQANK